MYVSNVAEAEKKAFRRDVARRLPPGEGAEGTEQEGTNPGQVQEKFSRHNITNHYIVTNLLLMIPASLTAWDALTLKYHVFFSPLEEAEFTMWGSGFRFPNEKCWPNCLRTKNQILCT